jgi:hypothetical protein
MNKNNLAFYLFFLSMVIGQVFAADILPAGEMDAPMTSAAMDDSAFLDLLQQTGVNFFWKEANSSNGLIKDRSASGSACSIASVGFGLTCICIGIDHGWIDRTVGRSRILLTLQSFWQARQGRDLSKDAGYKGFFYHFLNMNNMQRNDNTELSSIDSAILLMGAVYAKQYFDRDDPIDAEVRQLADSLYYRADWQWFRNYSPAILMEWFPNTGFGNSQWRGYNEAMMLYVLALGSPTHPAPVSCWTAWTSGYKWQTHYDYSYVNFPPLFGHQYSHCWIDFRGLQDEYMRKKGIDYFENSRRATLAQRAYCMANPGNFPDYGENLWGITASDVPNGYMARGAPPAENDNGTIAPTGPGGSIAFAPEVAIPALRNMYDSYRTKIWHTYGFRDAFNLKSNWWATDVIGIDQGCYVIMIENYRNGRVWQRFMKNPDIQQGLQRAGFYPTSAVQSRSTILPEALSLRQNYPNPFNASTTFSYQIRRQGHVRLQLYNLSGERVAMLVDEIKNSGCYSVNYNSTAIASGIYVALLSTPEGQRSVKFSIVK